jgi:hypothetical protein
MEGEAIRYIIVASAGTGRYRVHKKLQQVYKKGEAGAFKSRACRRDTQKVWTMFVVEKRRRERISKINANVLAPRGSHDV